MDGRIQAPCHQNFSTVNMDGMGLPFWIGLNVQFSVAFENVFFECEGAVAGDESAVFFKKIWTTLWIEI